MDRIRSRKMLSKPGPGLKILNPTVSSGDRNSSHQFNVPIVWIVVKTEVNPDKLFHCIVTGDESWIHYYDPLKSSSGRGYVNKHQLKKDDDDHKRWCSAHRVSATWNHDQWFF